MECVNSEYSEEEHVKRLHCLCRLCGERVKRNIKDTSINVKQVITYAEIVCSLFDVKISENSADKHSKCLCKKCQTNITTLC